VSLAFKLSVDRILFMVILGMFLAAFRIPRYFMKKYGPKPGEGPSQEAMERGGLKATFIGLSETEVTLVH
jgi:short subunit dehydrogenase-like uncharacterized protein